MHGFDRDILLGNGRLDAGWLGTGLFDAS